MSTRTPLRILPGTFAIAGFLCLSACSAPAEQPVDTANSRTLETGALSALPSPAGPGAGEANLTPADGGGVHMSWFEPVGDDTWSLRFATLQGAEWTEPRTIVSSDLFFVNWADFPSMADLGESSLVAHWPQRSGPGTYAYDVVLSRSEDGGTTWSEPFRPHEDGTQTEHGFVSLIAESDGGFTAVWLDGRNSAHLEEGAGAEMTLRSRQYAADGSAGPEQLLDDRICDCCQTSAARVGNRLLVAYRDRSDEEIRDISVVSRGPEGWSEPVTVGSDNWMIPGCPVNGPALASRGDFAAVAWFALVDEQPEVKLAFTTDAGASFAEPVLVERGRLEAATLGRVALQWIDDGTVFVSWLTTVGTEAELRARSVSVDGDAGPVQTLATTSPSRSSGFPRVARDGDRLVVAWRELSEPAVIRVGEIPLR